MSYLLGNPGNITQANNIEMGLYSALARESLQIEYTDIHYRSVIPAAAIDTSMGPGANELIKPMTDSRGAGTFMALGSNAVPQVGFTLGDVRVKMLPASIGCTLTRTEMQNSEFTGSSGSQINYNVDILARKTVAMREGAERHIERVVFFGDSKFGYEGILTNPAVPAATVALNEALTDTEWNKKTPDEIIFDIVTVMGNVNVVTRQVVTANALYVPTAQYNLIKGLKGGTRANDETVLNYVIKNGIAPIVRPLPYLAGAGAGATDRIVAATEEPKRYLMGMPIVWDLIAPIATTMGWAYVGDYKFSGIVFPYPLSFFYGDGV